MKASLLLGAILFLLYKIFSFPSDSPNSNVKNTVNIDPYSFDYKVRIGTLNQEVKDNIARAEEKYKGKRIFTLGEITYIGDTFDTGTVTVQFEDTKYTNDVLGLPIVSRNPGQLECFFKGKDKAKILPYDVGQVVYVRGTFSDKWWDGFSLSKMKNCLIEAY